MQVSDSKSTALRVLAALAALAVYYLAIQLFQVLRRAWVLRKLPSPPVDSILFGHDISRPGTHRRVQIWAEELGGAFYIRVLWKHVVYITDPFLVDDVFKLERLGAVLKPSQFNTIKDPVTGRVPSPNMFSEQTGHRLWRLVRKGAAPAFNPANLRHFHHHVVAVMEQLITGIRAKGPDAYVNIAEVGQRESYDVIGRVGFDHDFGTSKLALDASAGANFADTPDVFRVMGQALTESVARATNPLRRYLSPLLPSARRGEAAEHQLQATMRALVKTVRGKAAVDPRSIAGHLLALRDSGAPLDLPRLQAEFNIFFIAGSETTGHTIAWTLYLLGKHPDKMARLERELDEAGLLAGPHRPRPRPFAFSDISKLRYLDCCIKESMRMLPVAHVSMRRVAARDLTLGRNGSAVTLPRGVIISGSNLALMNNPANGWDRPRSFIPERFEDPDAEFLVRGDAPAGDAASAAAGGGPTEEHLDEAGGSGAARVGEQTKAKRFMPFGGGIRSCVGLQLAKMNAPTAVAMLVSLFNLELSPECAARDITELETTRATLQPKDGIWMRCTPRAPASEE